MWFLLAISIINRARSGKPTDFQVILYIVREVVGTCGAVDTSRTSSGECRFEQLAY